MPLVTVTYKCGHTSERRIGERHLKQTLEKSANRLCSKCYAAYSAAHANEYAEESAKAAQWCAQHNCVALEGSEKQVAWVESLRYRVLSGYENDLNQLQEQNVSQDIIDQAQKIITERSAETSAKWWIDHRNDKQVAQAVSLLGSNVTTPDEGE